LDSNKSIVSIATLLECNPRIDSPAVQGLFPEMFAEYHPELNRLLQMHFSMYPFDSQGGQTVGVAYLADAWEAICMNRSNTSLDAEHNVLIHLGRTDGP
jgi:hypothetical protein